MDIYEPHGIENPKIYKKCTKNKKEPKQKTKENQQIKRKEDGKEKTTKQPPNN